LPLFLVHEISADSQYTFRIFGKSDVGTYTYPLPGSALPHAVSAVKGTINSTFTYDANGNVTGGNNRGYTYFSFNKPLQISQSGTTYQNFLYDGEHARIWKAAPEGGTLYFDAFGMHVEWLTNNTWYDYISANGAMVAMRVSDANTGATTATRYFHTDNLGSIAVITDETGAVVPNGRQGYDAWGKRRWPNGADDTGSLPLSQTTRGFTGQEELSDVGLVHLNGRIYDPLIARMTSADPMVPAPLNGQAWNRYSYVVNNPLAFTDPSGYCFLGLCGFGNPAGFINGIMRDLGHLLRDVPILGSMAEIAVVAEAATFCAIDVPVCAVTAAFLSTTAISGLSSGNIGVGLKAGMISAAEAVAFWEVGNLTNVVAWVDPSQTTHITPQFGTPEYIFNVTAHAAVGCAAAVASGGQCGPSALAGGVTSAAGPFINGYGFGSLVANAALGGGTSVLGGGKFENGAITGAFGYLFNQQGGRGPNDQHEIGRQAAMQDAIDQGYGILAENQPVSLPGLPIRVYDFVMFDPASQAAIGVEVKTTFYETIFLNRQQVAFDIAVAGGQLGPALGGDASITAVAYYTYCGGCSTLTGVIRSNILVYELITAGIPVYAMQRVRF
jgi:RHS repeat-associated protein